LLKIDTTALAFTVYTRLKHSDNKLVPVRCTRVMVLIFLITLLFLLSQGRPHQSQRRIDARRRQAPPNDPNPEGYTVWIP